MISTSLIILLSIVLGIQAANPTVPNVNELVERAIAVGLEKRHHGDPHWPRHSHHLNHDHHDKHHDHHDKHHDHHKHHDGQDEFVKREVEVDLEERQFRDPFFPLPRHSHHFSRDQYAKHHKRSINSENDGLEERQFDKHHHHRPTHGWGHERGGNGGRAKRSMDEQLPFAILDEEPELLCPYGLNACPISTISSNYECVELNELENCGGCAIGGVGEDCSAIPHVYGVACVEGRCSIATCAPGYQLDSDSISCQPSLSP